MPPNREPMVSTSSPASITTAVPPAAPRSCRARRHPPQHDDQHERRHAERRRGGDSVSRCAPSPPGAGTNSAGTSCDLEAEEVLDLRAGDEHRDAVGEADDDRPRQVLDGGAHAAGAQHDQHHAGHHRAHEQAVTPCSATMPAMTTTKAPVGPPIW
jgi:hypothetical protein